jgi:hypothetical protein
VSRQISAFARRAKGDPSKVARGIALLRAQPGSRVAIPLRYLDPAGIRAAFSEARIQELIKAAPVETVSFAGMRTIQHTVKAGRAESYVRKPDLIPPGSKSPGGWPVDLPIVMRWKGELVLWDGNHRTTATILSGDSRGRARVVDLDAQSS